MMDDDPKAYEGLMREYFEKHYERHLREVNRRETPQGRMEEAFEESDGTIADGFYRFFESEINSYAGTCLVFMPDFGVNWRQNTKGKVVIEVVAHNSARDRRSDFFEFQLARKTNLMDVRLDALSRDPNSPNDNIQRFYNMHLTWEDAMPLAQRVLFSQLFRQRFLMTTSPAALGGVTAKRFLPHTGQVYAFRSCALTR
mgnify:FL=1